MVMFDVQQIPGRNLFVLAEQLKAAHRAVGHAGLPSGVWGNTVAVGVAARGGDGEGGLVGAEQKPREWIGDLG